MVLSANLSKMFPVRCVLCSAPLVGPSGTCAEIALLESRLKRPKFKKIAQITTGGEVREKEGEEMREKEGEG